ncbi:MAG: ROK family protein [Candidatus Omnitrophica bacterium]|nr:ROK family protein [Candidatus Omnitrophota bacterium]
MGKYVIGVDVGGTNIKLGLADARLNVIDRTKFATECFASDPTFLINEIAKQISSLIERNAISDRNISGIGIGLPGIVDHSKGIVRFLPNISGWKDIPLKKILEKKLGIRACLENDVNLIALGEWKFGAGRKVENMVCMTLGTGVGSGLILNGSLYRGYSFSAGELGHIPINEEGPVCGCGSYGCLESYVGNKRLVLRASEMINDPDISLEKMHALAKKGNRTALKFWDEAATHIGHALVGVVNMLNPQRIVIGGGVSNNHEFLFKTIHAVIQKKAMKVPASVVKIVRAQLGNDAGILGAHVLVHEHK